MKFLSEVFIFEGLSEKQLQSVAKHLTMKEVKAGEVVFSRLEREQVLYIVRYGEFILEMIGGDDLRFSKGDVFGEIAVINNNLRTGTVKAQESSLLFCLDGNDLHDPARIAPEISLHIILRLARRITTYLESAQNTSTQRLIELGENELVEFKSTLRYNLHSGRFGKEIEHAALKTIAAFLNSSGGTLVVGVDDDRNICGLEKDQFKDDDHVLLHLTNIIQERISTEHTRFVKGTVEQSNGLRVLRVDVKPAPTPAYLAYNSEEMLYVRTGPSTTPLRVSEIYSYIRSRFHENK